MFMGSATIVVVMYNAIRMDVHRYGALLSTRRGKIIDKAMNGPRRINECQGRTRREGAKGIHKGERNRHFDANGSGKTCQHWR
jgi:hypothetical protein